MTYDPLYIAGNTTGLVQNRQNFLIPPDAYPTLENMFLFREGLIRKSGCDLLGRLRRVLTGESLGNLDLSGDFSGNLITIFGLESSADFELGSIVVSDGVNTFTDNGDGTLTGSPAGSGTINYSNGDITITGGAGGAALTIDFNYFPNMPVMGLRTRELNDINSEQLVAFNQTYAFIFNGGWQEFISGTTWTGNDSDFFWSTNYWVGDGNRKIFWVTNFSGTSGDPIRYTNGTAWVDFAPTLDGSGNLLQQCLAMVPFRGRMVVFNTFEGATLAGSVQFRQRIRWAAIGNPFTVASSIVTPVNANAWRDDIRGQGGFLDIPTAENIVSIGFVRDNLVIFCESSTWQLRYTGRSIQPFQIEKVNTELGAESTFSAVQFDTSLVGIGDKGVVECDSYKSERIDIKIPDLVYRFNNNANGVKRVHGIRDFQQRIAYWTYVTPNSSLTYPNRRLLYNYENDSWAIFTDSYTTFGNYQPTESKRWVDFPSPEPDHQWQAQNYAWLSNPALMPMIVGGNQQGYVEFLGQYTFLFRTTNDVSLTISTITGRDTLATRITSPNHNLEDGMVIEITGIPSGTDFDNLNGEVFGVIKIDNDTVDLYTYSDATKQFDDPQLDSSALVYIGGGQISIRDNFNIVSKKFNFANEGQNIQFGFMDILMNQTDGGAITMNVFMDYNETNPINQFPQNVIQNTTDPDTFFNTVIPTYSENDVDSIKNFQRIYCNCRGAFITLQLTFSNAQMAGDEQETDVRIDSQILWLRRAGRQLSRGI